MRLDVVTDGWEKTEKVRGRLKVRPPHQKLEALHGSGKIGAD